MQGKQVDGSTAAPPGRTELGAPNRAEAPEVALVEQVALGDARAFETLYRLYHPRLCRFLGLMSSRRPLLEEALNDTMMVVWRRAGTFNGHSKVSTWIFAIAYRTALKALRRHDPLADEPAGDEAAEEAASTEASPEQQRSDGETREALARALDRLSTGQRSALVLAFFHDLPYAEIARIIDCPVDTVKTRVLHGRRRLRALLSGTLEDWL